MNWLRRFAQSAEASRSRVQIETEFYKTLNELQFLQSERGSEFATVEEMLFLWEKAAKLADVLADKFEKHVELPPRPV